MLTLLCWIFLQGWYRATVREYDNLTDVAKLEFDVEEGVLYDYIVREEGKKLKLAKDTLRMVDKYKDFFQIGALVEVKWSKEDVAEADLLPGMFK